MLKIHIPALHIYFDSDITEPFLDDAFYTDLVAKIYGVVNGYADIILSDAEIDSLAPFKVENPETTDREFCRKWTVIQMLLAFDYQTYINATADVDSMTTFNYETYKQITHNAIDQLKDKKLIEILKNRLIRFDQGFVERHINELLDLDIWSDLEWLDYISRMMTDHFHIARSVASHFFTPKDIMERAWELCRAHCVKHPIDIASFHRNPRAHILFAKDPHTIITALLAFKYNEPFIYLGKEIKIPDAGPRLISIQQSLFAACVALLPKIDSTLFITSLYNYYLISEHTDAAVLANDRFLSWFLLQLPTGDPTKLKTIGLILQIYYDQTNTPALPYLINKLDLYTKSIPF